VHVDRLSNCLGLVVVEAQIAMNNRIKILRAERNWSQAELADRLKVSRQTINAIETGKYDPSLPLAFSISALFGLKIEDIFSPE
jgi:putative transcriptional regulator